KIEPGRPDIAKPYIIDSAIFLINDTEPISLDALENPGEVARGRERAAPRLAEPFGRDGRGGPDLHVLAEETLRVLDRLKLSFETRGGSLERVAVRDLAGVVEKGRDLAGDRLAILEVDRVAARSLEHQAQDGVLSGPRVLHGKQAATLLRRDGPDLLGRFR